jgi:branched-chain amino acid transport system permease protein
MRRHIQLSARTTRFVGPSAVAVVLLGVLLSGSALWIYDLTLVATYAIVVIGLNIVLGYAGLVSFAQTAFMAVGGYAIAILSVRHGVDPWVGLVVGMIVAGVAAALIGLALFRLRGHYLTMASFALAMGVFGYAIADVAFTGGSVGIAGVAPFTVGSFTFLDATDAYILVWVLAGLCAWTGVRARDSHVGRAWRTIADNEDVAASLGLPVLRYKLIAFVIAGVMGALGGGLYVNFTTFVNPDLYAPTIIVNIFLMLFLGGRGRTLGPIVGAAIVVILPQEIAGLSDIQGIIFDLALLVLIVVLPGGLLDASSWRALAAPVRRLRGSDVGVAATAPDLQPAGGAAGANAIAGRSQR